MLTATEFLMSEPVPLHRVHDVIFEFCRGRSDIVVFGAQAVNVHVSHPRMSQDVDLLAADPSAVASALASVLRKELRIAARVREVRSGIAFRVYQSRKKGSRHLADVRLLDFVLEDPHEENGIRFTPPPLTVALKVLAFTRRRLAPKGATDLADIRRLLLEHSALRVPEGAVSDAIERLSGGEPAQRAWVQILAEPIISDEEADEGY